MADIKNIKNLKIDGVTYNIIDDEAARLSAVNELTDQVNSDISDLYSTKISADVANDTYVKYSAAQSLNDDQKAQARSNIGAGTSNLTIGTEATTAAAGNHNHDSAYLGKSAQAVDSAKLGGKDASSYLTSHQDISGKLDKNTAITGATKCKITYDAKGLVTEGADLAASDIPDLPASKITSGTISTSRLPAASGTSAGITLVYPAASCTTFSSDSGTVTPLAVQKGAKMFAIPRPSATTDKAIVRYSSTTGDVQDSKILIEDVTNTRDSSKTANVLSIPAEGGKKMVYGYCTDQVDGTSFIGGVFDKDATEFPYNQGLAIGGTSGNLLWKGAKVATVSDIPTVPTKLSELENDSGFITTASAGAVSSVNGRTGDVTGLAEKDDLYGLYALKFYSGNDELYDAVVVDSKLATLAKSGLPSGFTLRVIISYSTGFITVKSLALRFLESEDNTNYEAAPRFPVCLATGTAVETTQYPTNTVISLVFNANTNSFYVMGDIGLEAEVEKLTGAASNYLDSADLTGEAHFKTAGTWSYISAKNGIPTTHPLKLIVRGPHMAILPISDGTETTDMVWQFWYHATVLDSVGGQYVQTLQLNILQSEIEGLPEEELSQLESFMDISKLGIGTRVKSDWKQVVLSDNSEYVSLSSILPYLASFAPDVGHASITQLYKILGVETAFDAEDYNLTDTKNIGEDRLDEAVFYTPGASWPSDLGTPSELEQLLKTKPCILIDSRHTDWKGSILAYRESTQADYGFGTQLYDLWDKYDYNSKSAMWSHDNTSSSGIVTIATNSIVTNPIYKQPRSTFVYDPSTKILTIS